MDEWLAGDDWGIILSRARSQRWLGGQEEVVSGLAGAAVVVAEPGAAAGEQVTHEWRAHGSAAPFIQTDVGDLASSVRARITTFRDMLEVTPGDWDALMNLDLRGLSLCSQHAARVMVGKGDVIIHISSNHTGATLPEAELYAAAKGGVNALTRAMALSLGQYGIRVNSISPGFTDMPHDRRWLAARGGDAAEREVLSLPPAAPSARRWMSARSRSSWPQTPLAASPGPICWPVRASVHSCTTRAASDGS